MHEDGAGECVAKVDGLECQYICEDGDWRVCGKSGWP